jgi:uncharacterized protein YjhX (UPF0386 family)
MKTDSFFDHLTDADKDNLELLASVQRCLKLNGSVEALRKAGFEVKVDHLRIAQDDMEKINPAVPATTFYESTHELRKHYESMLPAGENYMHARGGRTCMAIKTRDGEEYKAQADCYVRDGYNRRKGVLICLTRIFRQMCEKYHFDKHQVKAWREHSAESALDRVVEGVK